MRPADCMLFAPVYVSGQDRLTDLTAREILVNNEVGRIVCGWKPAKTVKKP